MEVTQATISRDIKELRLIKVMTEDGRYKYAPFNSTDNTVFNRLMTVFSNPMFQVIMQTISWW